MKYILLIFTFSLWGTVTSQNGVLTSGSDGVSEYGEVSYSIGLPLFTTASTASGEVSLGIQQVNENRDPLGSEFITLEEKISVFPNPAEHWVVVLRNTEGGDFLNFKLFDLNGRVLLTGPIDISKTTIPLNGIASGTYLLKIANSDNRQLNFKIIKTN